MKYTEKAKTQLPVMRVGTHNFKQPWVCVSPPTSKCIAQKSVKDGATATVCSTLDCQLCEVYGFRLFVTHLIAHHCIRSGLQWHTPRSCTVYLT